MHRPQAYGYLQASLHPDGESLAAVRRELTEYADHEGFTLTEVFVEDDVHHTSAFAVLMDALHANDARCVITPSLRHFARLPGLRAAICARLRNAGVDLRVMHSECAALGLAEEDRAFRERESAGVETADLRYPAQKGSDSGTGGRGPVSPERGRATTLEGKDVR